MLKISSNNFTKILESLILITCSIWIGSQLTKLFTIYYFFEVDQYGRFLLKNNINLDSINLIAFQLTPIFVTPMITYSLFILFFLILIIFLRKKIKSLGWLFISLLIVIICLPLEIYLTFIDYDIFQYSFHRTGVSDLFLKLFEKRVTILGNFPIISLFLHLTLFLLIIFKPLHKIKIEN